jgi:D-alanyl-D-alanine endopeptidase (penicillin-binding protein 7)
MDTGERGTQGLKEKRMKGGSFLGWMAALCALPGVALAAPATTYPLDPVALKSHSVLVVDADTGETLAAKNADAVVAVASLTKLMTALVVLEAGQDLDEVLELTRDDIDKVKRTPSRLPIGAKLRRDDLLLLALMASENRSALALSRNYPGGRAAFVTQMNAIAGRLGMAHTRFTDAAGLSATNRSTARDLAILLEATHAQPLIRDYSTRAVQTLRVGRKNLKFYSSNRLVRGRNWDIGLQKTGYTNEAGRCLVMQATVEGRRLAMIFLNSVGKLTRYGDASRVRAGLAQSLRAAMPGTPAAAEANAAP